MSEDQEQHLREIIRDEQRKFMIEADARATVARRWWIGTFAIAFAFAGAQIVSDHTTMKNHLSDGHPTKVIELVNNQGILLREIKVMQANIREDLAELKKGIDKKL